MRGALAAWLPMLLMMLLALGTWWLVKNTPTLDAGRQPAAPVHVPDYTMRDFSVQRYAAAGAMRVQLDGDVMRHYPDTDTLEIDEVRIRAVGRDGRITRARARSATSNGAATEVQLQGGAEVVQEGRGGQPDITMKSEFLHVFVETERVRSHLPVVVTQGATVMHADAFEYDHLSQTLTLKGKVRSTFAPPARPTTRRVVP